jgi:hypothetical protein
MSASIPHIQAHDPEVHVGSMLPTQLTHVGTAHDDAKLQGLSAKFPPTRWMAPPEATTPTR